MSYPVWPETLPRPERSSWQATHQDARLRRRSDAGPMAYRRRFSSAARPVSLSMIVDRDGKAIFDNFFREEIGGGATLFWLPDPTTDGWPLLMDDGTPLLTDDGTPLLLGETWLVTMGQQLPTETIIGSIEFRISFSIEVMP